MGLGKWACPRRLADIGGAEQREIIREYTSGSGCLTIARKHGTSHKFVLRWLRMAGIAIRNPHGRPSKVTKDMRIQISQMYLDGCDMRAVAQQFKITESHVGEILKQEQIVAREKGRYRWRVNHRAFDVITEESAYWLGFLMADGCIFNARGAPSGIQIALSSIDRGHLEKFRKFIGSNAPIRVLPLRHGPNSMDGSKPLAFIRVCSRAIAKAAIQFGVTPAKSLTAQCKQLEMNRHFWRGVIDGDGSIFVDRNQYPRISLCSASEGFIKQYSLFAASLGLFATTARSSPVWYIRFNGAKALLLIEYLYGDATIFLQRKMAKANDVLTGQFAERLKSRLPQVEV
jgi:hypothetical protein